MSPSIYLDSNKKKILRGRKLDIKVEYYQSGKYVCSEPFFLYDILTQPNRYSLGNTEINYELNFLPEKIDVMDEDGLVIKTVSGTDKSCSIAGVSQDKIKLRFFPTSNNEEYVESDYINTKTIPAFTKQPYTNYKETPRLVYYSLNFSPVKVELWEKDGELISSNGNETTCAGESGAGKKCFVRAYYGENAYIDSDPVDIAPYVFTQQPEQAGPLLTFGLSFRPSTLQVWSDEGMLGEVPVIPRSDQKYQIDIEDAYIDKTVWVRACFSDHVVDSEKTSIERYYIAFSKQPKISDDAETTYNNSGKIRIEYELGFQQPRYPEVWTVDGEKLVGKGGTLYCGVPKEVIGETCILRAFYGTGDDKYIESEPFEVYLPVYVEFSSAHSANMEYQTVKVGGKMTRPDDPVPVDEGWDFCGWFTDSKKLNEFDFDTPVDLEPFSTLWLYAKWERTKNIVTFDKNGGGTELILQEVTYGNTATEPEPLTMTGYKFCGWFTQENCAAAYKYDFSTPVKAPITLYAKWKKLHTVIFYENFGTGSIDQQQIADGEKLTLPECTFGAPDGYRFLYWNVIEDGISIGYKHPYDMVTVSGDVIVSAQWQKIVYKTVTFNANGHGVAPEAQTVELNATAVEPAAPDAINYEFVGWFTYRYNDDVYSSHFKYDFSQPVTEDITLYAAWKNITSYAVSLSTASAAGITATLDREAAQKDQEVTITVTQDDPYYELRFAQGVPYYDDSTRKWVTGTVNPSAFEQNGSTLTYTFPMPAQNLYINVYSQLKEGHTHSYSSVSDLPGTLEFHEAVAATCTEKGSSAYWHCTVCGHYFRGMIDGDYPYVGDDITQDWENRISEEAKGHYASYMTPASDPTCTYEGHMAYWRCNRCGLKFAEEACVNEIDDVSLPIDVNGHWWGSTTSVLHDDTGEVTAETGCIYDSSHSQIYTVTLGDISDGDMHNVALRSRTLYKDGKWNTLCLPFSVDNIESSPLSGATVKELDVTGKNGLDAESGTLYLSFKTATQIEAGKPYLVKWESGTDIVEPVFTDVTITSTAPTAVVSATSGLEEVTMTGNYSPVSVAANDQSIMFMGGDNTLYYTTTDRTLRCFRAHFGIESQNKVHSFVMNFSDDVATGVSLVQSQEPADDSYYDLQGRKLSGKPTKAGIYINQGRKISVK